jgi:hypothetical protein
MTKNWQFKSAIMAVSAAWLTLLVPGGLSSAQDAPATAYDLKGIWGAIAYSASDRQVGMFWGADKKEQAEESALRHCRNTLGADCTVVTVFRNRRGGTADDGSGFPYEHCGALAIGPAGAMGAASATNRADAETKALDSCGGEEKLCKIREWVCT